MGCREARAKLSYHGGVGKVNDSEHPATGHWPREVHDVRSLAATTSRMRGVRKGELKPGDTLVVRTRNSFYAIGVLSNDEYAVAGGWFDQNDARGANVAINGCTWGGRAIITDMLAAPGLFLEFGNGVRTTRILAVAVLVDRRHAIDN